MSYGTKWQRIRRERFSHWFKEEAKKKGGDALRNRWIALNKDGDCQGQAWRHPVTFQGVWHVIPLVWWLASSSADYISQNTCSPGLAVPVRKETLKLKFRANNASIRRLHEARDSV